MKFGKEFVSQMVPEWQEAYMDYNQLKTLLKEILLFKQKNNPTLPLHHPDKRKRKLTLYRAFSGLTQNNKGAGEIPPTPRTPRTPADFENQVISVDSVSIEDGTRRYETVFLKAGEAGAEHELVYFRRLDDEFNKVHQFYMTKVEEVMEEAVMLEKQMHALIAFRIKVLKPDHDFDDMEMQMTSLVTGIEASAAILSASTPQSAKSSRRFNIDTIEEVSKEGFDDYSEEKEVKTTENKIDRQKLERILVGKEINPLQILDHVKMNIVPETPVSSISCFLNDVNRGELKFNKENLKKSQEKLRQAFIEFYHKLRLLKNYSFMNMLAFSKIMKKYDKIASRRASRPYMKMVDESFLGSSNQVSKLMDRVEATFIKHFTNSNRATGMKILRPKPKREKHRTTFAFGFFAGGTVALILALILIIRARNIIDHPGSSQYMNTMFPLYSLFGFVVLHMLMYAANIYFWRRYRVNYSFIFGYKQGTELGYRDVLYLSFGLAVIALASVMLNLDMEMDLRTLKYEAFTELLPLFVLLIIIGIIICPFNVIYRSSRFFLLSCFFHCLCAPLYKVTLPDSLLADQLTSQVQAIRSLEFYICYYSSGEYLQRQNTCRENSAYNTFYFIVAAIPYVMRFLQCLRRLWEEKDTMHAYNGLKYFSIIVAVSTRTAYNYQKGKIWRIVAWFWSAIAAFAGTYWDIVIDWGLLQHSSKNFLLRDKLLIPHNTVYYTAVVLNVMLRFAWLQTVLNIRPPVIHTEALVAIFAGLEIVRRGIWNFFRLENEHLNNVGKFRAFKSVPLPFNYDGDVEKHE